MLNLANFFALKKTSSISFFISVFRPDVDRYTLYPETDIKYYLPIMWPAGYPEHDPLSV